MTAETLRQHVKREPFVPFTICMNDGTRLKVKRPDFVAVPPGWERTAIVCFPRHRFTFVHIPYVKTRGSEEEA
jgi:hypothetical protein